MSVKDELNLVFREVFKDDSIEVFREMTEIDIDMWDSFSHATLLMSVEDHFDISFASREIMNLPNVGALMDLIERKLAEKPR
ncbi:MAG: acyl carrier protein [Chloroflexi bacterium]|nr:acyl carrier protein [Chloroflexota bacterium]